MSILLIKSELDRPDQWRGAFGAAMPDLELRFWPDIGDPAAIDYALLWAPPAGIFARLPNLRILFSIGAGVDHLLSVPTLPRGVPLVRMVDETLTRGMTEFVVYQVLRQFRLMPTYERQQREGIWLQHLQPTAGDVGVGILGMGVLGANAARALAGLGFDVAGWSRTRKDVDGVRSFAGDGERNAFLARTDILVCLLPLTAATRGIVDRDLLHALPRGASLINAARGEQVIEADLLEALDSGQLAEAALDVFASEPLPPGHPFWRHPRVSITPHVASMTLPKTSVAGVVENIRRHRRGEALLHVVDPEAGY
jgi:glyoxylate/hydroxypyruvate reductase A